MSLTSSPAGYERFFVGRGLYEATRAYGTPLISGKDSMKNEAVMEASPTELAKMHYQEVLLLNCHLAELLYLFRTGATTLLKEEEDGALPKGEN